MEGTGLEVVLTVAVFETSLGQPETVLVTTRETVPEEFAVMVGVWAPVLQV